jgi:GNAT superfamily N-acetyltransferase
VPAGLTTDEAIAALESNLWSMWSQFGQGDGCRLVVDDLVTRIETPLAHIPYNTVLRYHGDAGGIDAIVEAYRRRDVPMVWVLHPTARPADLASELEARGLEEAEVVAGMVAGLAALPDDGPVEGVTVEEVGVETAEPFIDLISWRYGLTPDASPTLHSIMRNARFGEPGSPNRSWIARRDGEVLSKVTTHIAGAVAGVYGVATKPEARGLGLARHLTLHALREARAAGATVGALHSTPMAVSLYVALGFEPVTDFALYAEPGRLHL